MVAARNSKLQSFARSGIVDVCSRLVLAGYWIVFLARHLYGFLDTGKPSLALFAISESIAVILFLGRRRAREVSSSPGDWVVAGAGTLVVLLYRPNQVPDPWWGDAVVLVGLIGQLGSLLSLGRSFGIVPANRGIQQHGLYRWVRHPMYASYLVMFIGYALANATTRNAGILCMAAALLIIRIHREEALLVTDPRYASYRENVRWRLVPGFY